MMKMEFTLDEAKVERDGLYDIADLKEHIDKTLGSLHIKKVDDGVFVGTGSEQDYANFGSAIILLKRAGWVFPYVDKWLHFSSNGLDNEDDFCVENTNAFDQNNKIPSDQRNHR